MNIKIENQQNPFRHTFHSIQSSRGIRRFPQKRWHPKRKVVLYWANKELTQENKDFLKSTYNDINPISPDIKNISTQEWNPESVF